MATGPCDFFINAAHRGNPATEVFDLDVDALKGVSTGDKQNLKDPFGVMTINDLGRNHFSRTTVQSLKIV